MSFLAANPANKGRIESSVVWTEEYRDRVKDLFKDQSIDAPSPRTPMPVRGILLQNIHSGRDGAIQLIGRNGIDTSFYVEIIGRNNHPTTDTFKLALSGGKLTSLNKYDPPTNVTLIGISQDISLTATAVEMQQAMFSISRTRLTPTAFSVGLGNPMSDYELQQYGDVVAPTDPNEAPTSYVGVWYINIPTWLFPEYDVLILEPTQAVLSSLVQITCRPSYDLLSPEVTLATDVDYRTPDFPWQVGTIATCLDYGDVGFGIIRTTFRNIEIVG